MISVGEERLLGLWMAKVVELRRKLFVDEVGPKPLGG